MHDANPVTNEVKECKIFQRNIDMTVTRIANCRCETAEEAIKTIFRIYLESNTQKELYRHILDHFDEVQSLLTHRGTIRSRNSRADLPKPTYIFWLIWLCAEVSDQFSVYPCFCLVRKEEKPLCFGAGLVLCDRFNASFPSNWSFLLWTIQAIIELIRAVERIEE